MAWTTTDLRTALVIGFLAQWSGLCSTRDNPSATHLLSVPPFLLISWDYICEWAALFDDPIAGETDHLTRRDCPS